MKRKLGVSTIGAHPEKRDIYYQIELFARTGFDVFFTGSDKNVTPAEAAKWAECATKAGLEFETIHAPFYGANDLWKDAECGETFLDILKLIIDQCKAADVHKMISHVTIGNTAPDVSEVGLSRFARLEEYAEKNEVHLCYENLEPLPHIHELMKHAGPYHGFCLDIGHNLCYTPHLPMMSLYGDRIICTHIHDNLGVTQPGNIDYRDDLHLLPFDGTMDWKWFAATLASTGYKGPLTFELSCANRAKYKEVTFDEFVADAFSRAVRIRDMFPDEKD